MILVCLNAVVFHSQEIIAEFDSGDQLSSFDVVFSTQFLHSLTRDGLGDRPEAAWNKLDALSFEVFT